MRCSDKVAGKGCFGASLMLEPRLVADCCAAMAAATDVPITVKCRLGAPHALSLCFGYPAPGRLRLLVVAKACHAATSIGM